MHLFLRLTAYFYLIIAFNLTLKAQTNLNFQSLLSYNHATDEEMSNLWGYSVSGHDYVIAGSTEGTSVVDITNAANPVEILWVPGPWTYWREVKVFGSYAYIVNEDSGGLQIINLSALPNGNLSLSNVSYWTGGTFNGQTYSLQTAHTIFIDENGIGYLFGGNVSNGGALMVNLASNPTNPPIVGRYNQHYIHDGFVRNDTLWACHINDGFFSVIDISNKANPITLATQNTSSSFSHNIWLSNDSHYAFTTDEVSGSYIDAYDVSDLSDIRLVGQFRASSQVIQHNIHVTGHWGVISSYRDGVVVIDLTHPEKMIEVGRYDTSPNYTGNGFNGCWGVYPYFPSGKMAATDIEEGLYVFAPTYPSAAYLQGTVTDANTGAVLSGVSITFSSNPALSTTTNVSGTYITGAAIGGIFTVSIAKAGYQTYTTNVTLTGGLTQTLNVALTPDTPLTLTGTITNNGAGLSGASVAVVGSTGTYTATTNSTGAFSVSLPGSGIYSIYAGKWGYQTQTISNQLVNAAGNTVTLALPVGYYDDFLFDFGWTANTTASSGAWVREEPYGTVSNSAQANPEYDITTDYGDKCYVTGNLASPNAGDSDVDNGSTVLTSPVFNLSLMGNPQITYWRWFRNSGGNTSPDDHFYIRLSNGTSTVTVETVNDGDAYEGQWKQVTINVASFITPTATMRLIADIGDTGNPHLVEGGIDGFRVSDLAPPQRFLATVLLEGAYDNSTNLMRTNLRAANLIPTVQPYSGAPWNYSGSEQVANSAAIPSNAVDWVLVEARQNNNNLTLLERRAGFVLADGTLVGTDGTAGIPFFTLNSGTNYRFTVRHRNHLAVMSASAISFPNTTAYNYTQSSNIFGSTGFLAFLENSKYGLIGADSDGNGVINNADYNRYKAQLNQTNQYLQGDFDLNGTVNINDFPYYQERARRMCVIYIR